MGARKECNRQANSKSLVIENWFRLKMCVWKAPVYRAEWQLSIGGIMLHWGSQVFPPTLINLTLSWQISNRAVLLSCFQNIKHLRHNTNVFTQPTTHSVFAFSDFHSNTIRAEIFHGKFDNWLLCFWQHTLGNIQPELYYYITLEVYSPPGPTSSRMTHTDDQHKN